MKMPLYKRIFFATAGTVLSFPLIMNAMGTTGQPNTASKPDTSFTIGGKLLVVNDIKSLISLVLGWVVNIGAVVVTLAFVWAGFKFVAARGNPEGIASAKRTFFWTVVGTLVLLGAQTLAAVIENTLTK